MTRVWIGAVLLSMVMPMASEPGRARGAEPRPSLTIRLVRPDQQGERLIGLFQGSRAPHPAAVLSAWKRANRTGPGPGKRVEGAIAALNPGMVRELRTLDAAEFVFRIDPADGRVRWRALVPSDDGTFAAVATALALTDGGSDPPLDSVPVDRTGPPGSPLIARFPAGLAVAGTREELAEARDHPLANAGAAGGPSTESGWLLHVDPETLGTTGPVPRRRAAEALRGLRCQGLDAVAGLQGETLSVAVTARLDALSGSTPPLDPRWLDWVPASSTLAAVAVAVDPRPEAWDAFFALADRVDRADPARAQVAPLRTRLNLLAAAALVRPEVDLWPALRGLTFGLTVDAQGELNGGFLALHVEDEDAADRLARQVLPRIAARYIKGKPLTIDRRGTTILAGWGGSVLAACLDAQAHPERSAGAAIRASWEPTASSPHRAGAFWPGRLRTLATPGSPAAEALAEAPPILWSGRNDETTTRDSVRWTGLRGVVRRFLEQLPMDPPPDS